MKSKKTQLSGMPVLNGRKQTYDQSKPSMPMYDHPLKPRILIVDDERNIADTLALILNAHGFESKAVYNGEAALEAAAQFRPDILISDVIMGGTNGIESAILISKMLPKCKVILFSGQASTEDLISQAVSEGHTFDILAKPIYPEVLIERIKGLAPSASA